MELSHHILLVDDEPQIGKAMERLLTMEGLDFTFIDNAPDALIKVQSTDTPFSLVISDQRMPEMLGTEFLKMVKQISPDSIRFLLTAHSDMDTVTHAINQGAVHKFIHKPWDNKGFLSDIKSALKRFEQQTENHALFQTAVDQNRKLYLLDRKLMESTKQHAAALEELELKIVSLRRRVGKGNDTNPADTDGLKEEIKTQFKEALGEEGVVPEEFLARLHAHCLADLFHQFTLLSNRNGFEMPISETET